MKFEVGFIVRWDLATDLPFSVSFIKTLTLSMTDSMTDSKTDSKIDSKTANSFLNYKLNIGSWAEYTDSEDDEPVPTVPTVPTVPEPVQPKTWGKLPNRVEPVRVEPVLTVTKQKSNGIRTLMVKNLPRDTTPEKLAIELRSIFKTYGPIKDVYIPINRDGQYAGTIKGFAKVQFHNSDHSAIAVTQSITIRKNKLCIEYAKEDR